MRSPGCAVAFVVIAAGVLAGCGSGEEGASATLAPVQPTTYVTVDAPTTTTTTTPPPAPTAPSGQAIVEEERIYTVEAGDNLYRIATRFGITLDDLLAYNGITTDYFLMPGQTTLKIPAGSVSAGGAAVPAGSTPPAGTAGATTTRAPGAGCVHVVVEGDYQGKLAQQYGVSLDALAAANADNPAWNRFLIGDEITIPAGGSC